MFGRLTGLGGGASAVSSVVSAIRAAGLYAPIPMRPEDADGSWCLDREGLVPFTDAALEIQTGIRYIHCASGNPIPPRAGADVLGGAGAFDSSSGWTAETGWAVSGGVAIKTAGTGSNIYRSASLTAGATYLVTYTVIVSAGTFTPQFAGGTTVNGTSRITSGTYSETIVAAAGNNLFRLNGNAAFAGTVDNVTVREVITDTSWLGNECITNGNFAAGLTSWSQSSTNWVSSGGGAAHAAGNVGALYQSALVVGEVYRINVRVTSYTSGALKVQAGLQASPPSISATGTYTYVQVCTSDGLFRLSPDSGSDFVGTVDDVSVRRVPGVPRQAPSGVNGPVPTRRLNQLQRTRKFSDAAWGKSGGMLTTDNAATAPDGSTTAGKLIPPSGAVNNVYVSQASTGRVFRAYAKAGERSWLMVYSGVAGSNAYFDLSSGTKGAMSSDVASASITAIGSGWYLVEVVWNTASTLLRLYSVDGSGSTVSTGNGSDGIYVCDPDVRLQAFEQSGAPKLPQRVGDGSAGVCDYDTTGYPLWLSWAGGRRLQTISAWAPGGDALRVGVVGLKLSDAASEVLVESSASSSVNDGTYVLATGAFFAGVGTTGFGYRSRGTAVSVVTVAGSAAPALVALGATSVISTDSVALRLSAASASGAADQGSGLYTSQIIYDGHRSGGTQQYTGLSDGPAAILPGDIISADLFAAYLAERAAAVGHIY